MQKIILFFSAALIFIFSNISVSRSQTFQDSVDVLKYDINLDILNMGAKRIDGFTTITMVSLEDSLKNAALDLLGLTVDSVICNGTNLAYVQLGEKVFVNLQNSLNTGDTFNLTLFYGGHPEMDATGWGGFYFGNDSLSAFNLGVGFDANPHNYGRVWFPCLDNFTDKALFDCKIRVPYGLMAVCGGQMIDVNDNGDSTRTYFWKMSEPASTYLASVAVGRYSKVSDVYVGIDRHIPVEIYVRPQDSLNAVGTFANLNTALSIYENHFGPYAWERVGYVGVPFNSGAMEHATNIAYPASIINGSTAYDDLMAHELAHSWFGNLVTCSNAGDMWLNEGWASFAEFVYFEQMYGTPYMKDIMRNILKNVLQMGHRVDGGYHAVCGVPHELTYSRTVYDKGSLIAHNMRTYLGDSLFFAAITQFMHDYAFSDISCIGFQNFLTTETQQDMSDFFNTWVFEGGFPHFSVDSFIVNEIDTNLFEVDVYVRQKLNGRTSFADGNSVEISFVKEDWGSYTQKLIFSGEFGHEQYYLDFNPKTVILNLNENLCHAATSYVRTVKQTGNITFPETHFTADVSGVQDSAFVRVTHNWVAPDSLKTPSPDIVRLSDYRYWTIEGVDFQKLQAKGRFYYNRSTPSNVSLESNGWLDNTLFTSSADSLLLLYRKDAADDWKIQSFSRIGNNLIGYIVADTLKKGEYALAIGTPVNASTSELMENSDIGFNVMPNPSEDTFLINFPSGFSGMLFIYDLKGRKIFETAINDVPFYKWTPENLAKGSYLVVLQKNDNTVFTRKIIFVE
ncbi:MAG: M1 family aminopeptidase [Bacteroidales bacterium]|nr:M1 family aminopeptidase [Bacteroidales bacterium]